MTYDVETIRRDFPILSREVNGKPLVYLDNGARMPRRVMIWTLIVMWTAIGISSFMVGTGDTPRPDLAAVIAAAGLVGSFFVIRLGTRRAGAKTEPAG